MFLLSVGRRALKGAGVGIVDHPFRVVNNLFRIPQCTIPVCTKETSSCSACSRWPI